MRKGLIIILLALPLFSLSQSNSLAEYNWQPDLFSSGKVYCYSIGKSENPIRYISFSIINEDYWILTWDSEFNLKQLEKVAFEKQGMQLKQSYYYFGRTRDTAKLKKEYSYGRLFPSKISQEINWYKSYTTPNKDVAIIRCNQKVENFTKSDSLIVFKGTVTFSILKNNIDSLKDTIRVKTTYKKGIGPILEEAINNKDTVTISLLKIIDNKIFESKKQMYYSKTDSLLRAFNIDKKQLEKALNEDKITDSSAIVYNMILDSIALRKQENYNTKMKKVFAAQEIGKKADSVKIQADELFSIIEQYKVDLINNITGGFDSDSIPIDKDNQYAGYTYLAISNNGERGKILENKIDNFKMTLLSLVKDTSVANRINRMLATEDSNEDNWIGIISNHLPLAAVTANLTLLQTYIRNAEAESVEYLAREIEKK